MERMVMLVKSYTLKTWVNVEELAEFMEVPAEELEDADFIAAAQEQIADWMDRKARYPEGCALVKIDAVYTDFEEVNQ